jgi:Na+-transporting NADH:ubiquinone oxidoreductase subunit NqrC
MPNEHQNISQIPKKSITKGLKFAAILTLILSIGIAAFYYGILFPEFWQALRQEKINRKIWNQIQAQKKKEAEDPYGGRTPQELYELFLKALEKQDIDLAVKYFAFEKQEKIRTFLTDVRDRGKWQQMYDAFSGKNIGIIGIEYEKFTDDWYAIRVRANDGLVAAFYTKKNPNSNLWKFTEFW